MSAAVIEPSAILVPVTASVARSVVADGARTDLRAVTASFASSPLPTAPPRTLEPVTASLPRSALPTLASWICRPVTAPATIFAVTTLLRARSTFLTCAVADLVARDRVVLDLLGADVHGGVGRAAEATTSATSATPLRATAAGSSLACVPPRWCRAPTAEVDEPTVADGCAESVKSSFASSFVRRRKSRVREARPRGHNGQR